LRTALFVAMLLSCTGWAASADKLITVDEAAVRNLIAANKGKVVLLSFWATWCEPCRAEMPHIVTFEQKLAAKGLKVIVISADEPEQEQDALRFVRDQHVAMPAYIKRAENDQRFIDSIDPKWSGALPALFLYDRTGRRVATWIGEADLSSVETQIRSQLARQ
jgi:thiol-disulfide isomerase/thioredoxin